MNMRTAILTYTDKEIQTRTNTQKLKKIITTIVVITVGSKEVCEVREASVRSGVYRRSALPLSYIPVSSRLIQIGNID